MQSFECAQIFNHFFLSIFLGTGAQKETEEFFLLSATFLIWSSSKILSFKTVPTVILIKNSFFEKIQFLALIRRKMENARCPLLC